KQQSTSVQRRPDGTIQDTMICLKVGRCAESHDPENGSNRPLSRSKDSACHENFDMLPHGTRKDRGKDPNSTAKGDRQGEHRHPFGGREHWMSLPINCDANCDQWIKSSLEAVWKQSLYNRTLSVIYRARLRTNLLDKRLLAILLETSKGLIY